MRHDDVLRHPGGLVLPDHELPGALEQGRIDEEIERNDDQHDRQKPAAEPDPAERFQFLLTSAEKM
ncbi:MAG: hypothetical protein ACTHLU_14855 [Novosphingobium sp.]